MVQYQSRQVDGHNVLLFMGRKMKISQTKYIVIKNRILPFGLGK